MINVIFIYKNTKTTIPCNIHDIFKDIFIEFGIIEQLDISNLSFIYKGAQINKEITLGQILSIENDNKENKSVNEINIFVKELNIEEKTSNDVHNLYFLNKSKFIKNPSFKYKETITTDNYCYYGRSHIFEAFISYKDNQAYIVIISVNNSLDIYTLIDKKKIFSLKGHQNEILLVRYFINEFDHNEYLVSGDKGQTVIVWDLTKNYSIKHIIKTEYYTYLDFMMKSCLLMFPHINNNNEGYIITSDEYACDLDNTSTRVYSLNTGNFIKNINNTKNEGIIFLLSWYNKNNNNYYIVQLANCSVLISNLFEDELYCSLSQEPETDHSSGFIYNKNNIDYLCTSSNNGFINIWDLYCKNLFKVISLEGALLTDIIQWNEKYAIVCYFYRKHFFIIDLENYKIINNGDVVHDGYIKCIKKIYHPVYGESLLSADENKNILLWSI